MANADRCIMCGAIIPEGRQLCPSCEKGGGISMSHKYESLIYAVDFDGTLCENTWPGIGAPNTQLIKHLIKRRKQGAKIILWTCRCGEKLQEAVEWCKEHGLEFDAVNENLPEMIEKYGNDSRKIYANVYIDDLSGDKEKYHIPFHPERRCRTCGYHDSFSWVCSNGESINRADFTEPEDTCDRWENKST